MPFDASNPFSYFRFDTYLSVRYSTLLCRSMSLPLAALILVICLQGKSGVIDATRELSPAIVKQVLPSDLHTKSDEWFRSHFAEFSFLSPLVLLIACLVLFSPYVNNLMSYFENIFISATGLDRRIDRHAMAEAGRALERFNNSYDSLRKALANVMQVDMPLHEGLISATPQQKAAYLLLFAARETTREQGLRVGLQKIQEQLETIRGNRTGSTEKELPTRNHLRHNTPTLMAGKLPFSRAISIGTFVVFCALFSVLFAGIDAVPVVVSDHWSPALFEWVYEPRYAVMPMLRFVFCFLLPLYLGFLVYLSRRRSDLTPETIGDCVRAACLQQTVVALVLTFTFSIADSISLISGDQSYVGLVQYTILAPQFWFDVITFSLLPSLVFLGWTFLRYGLHRRGVWLAVSLLIMSSLAPAFQSFGYEWYTDRWRGLYWYWATLGLYTTSSLLLVGVFDVRIRRRVLPVELQSSDRPVEV